MIQAVSIFLSSHILSLIDSEANMVAGGWVAHQEATIPTVSLEVLEKRLNGKEKELFFEVIHLWSTFQPPLTSCKVSDIVEIAFSYITARGMI